MLLFIFLLSQRRLFIFIPPLYINVFNNCVECIHVFPCLLRLRKIVTVNITSIYCRNKISVGSCLLLLLCLWFVVVVDDDDFNGAGGWVGMEGINVFLLFPFHTSLKMNAYDWFIELLIPLQVEIFHCFILCRLHILGQLYCC